MLFELLTTTIMGGIALSAYTKKQDLTENDSGKIQRIISLSGLNVKDGKDTLTTQLIRKKKYDWGWEYKYRIPLGRNFEDYLAKRKNIEDGLNNRKRKLTVMDFKELKFDKNIISSLMNLKQQKLTDTKEVEMSFDGLLCVRVYDAPLPLTIPYRHGTEWKVPVGITRDKNSFKYHDFERIPHLVLGGATRYGKSNFINSTIISLLHSQPDNVYFYLIDLKGGVELCDYENIRQTNHIAYEPEEALQALFEAYEKMKDIQQKLKSVGKKNVQQAGIKERYFVIVDEAGELNPSAETDKDIKRIKEECQNLMSQIARLGAGLGFRLITATQYPTGDVINRSIKQNSDAKLSFRVQSAIASRVVLDSEGAESLPQIVGRAIYQTADKREILQTPLIRFETIKEVIQPHVLKKEREVVERTIQTVERKARTNTVTFEEV